MTQQIERILSRWEVSPQRTQTVRALTEVLQSLSEDRLKCLEPGYVALWAESVTASAFEFRALPGDFSVFVVLGLDLERIPYAETVLAVRRVIVYAICRIEGMDERGARAAAAEITRSADLGRQVQEGGYPVM